MIVSMSVINQLHPKLWCKMHHSNPTSHLTNNIYLFLSNILFNVQRLISFLPLSKNIVLFYFFAYRSGIDIREINLITVYNKCIHILIIKQASASNIQPPSATEVDPGLAHQVPPPTQPPPLISSHLKFCMGLFLKILTAWHIVSMQCLQYVFHFLLSQLLHRVYLKVNQNNPLTWRILPHLFSPTGSEIPGSPTVLHKIVLYYIIFFLFSLFRRFISN